jgi:DNA-binding response OmpR family regulator
MAKILVVEDDADLLKTIRQCLEFEHFTVETSETGNEAIHRLRAYSYDLVLLDWQLPDLTGVEVCRFMRANQSHTPVLMMTAKKDVEEKEIAFDSGADDYLTKPFNLKELSARVRAILRRGQLVATDNRLQLSGITLDTKSCQVFCENVEIKLIPKEFAILELLMRNRGQIFSAEQIVSRVWQSNEEAEPGVVRGHIKNIRKKLNAHAKDGLVVTVHGFGYKVV